MGKVRVSLAHSEIWAPELAFQFFFVYCSFGYSITYSMYVYLSREKGAFYWSIKFINTTFKAVSDSKVVEPIPQSQNNSLGQRKYLWLPFKAA